MLYFLQEGELITETFFQADDIADPMLVITNLVYKKERGLYGAPNYTKRCTLSIM
jgi:hypothetical protein